MQILMRDQILTMSVEHSVKRQELAARLAQVPEQYQKNTEIDRVYWIWQANYTSGDDCVNTLRHEVEAQGVHYYLLDGRQADSMGYSTLLPIIRETVELLLTDEETHTWLHTVGPELLYLHADWKKLPLFADVPALTDIALFPSRRRLHKESEQMFRVTQVIVELLLKRAKRDGGKAVFHFEHLERMDEHTIRCFARLARCLSHQPVVVIATVAELEQNDIRFAENEDSALAILPGRVELRRLLLEKVRNRVQPKTLAVSDEAAGERSERADEHLPWRMSEGAGEEQRCTQLLLAALSEGKCADIEAALLPALETAVFTQNFDHAFHLAHLAWPYMSTFAGETQVEVWNHLAMAFAFMEYFSIAVEVFRRAGEYAHTPVKRAENAFFLGLLHTKRLNDTTGGRRYLQNALTYIAGHEGEAADVERAFIYNALALTYVNERNTQEAFRYCRKALECIKQGRHSPDATHIKINVISNITVLYEYSGELERALKHWMYFESFLKASGPIFAKHYGYRKGNLLFKLKRYAEARAAFLESYELAERLHDDFHRDIITRAIAVTFYYEERYAEATEWYRISLAAKRALLQEDELPRVCLALALCLEQTGGEEAGQAREKLEQELACQENGSEAASLGREALQLWEDRQNSRWQALVKWAFERPDIKLNRPFAVTNLY
jgi:tetratricopeptide (TPR) repeat protein